MIRQCELEGEEVIMEVINQGFQDTRDLQECISVYTFHAVC